MLESRVLGRRIRLDGWRGDRAGEFGGDGDLGQIEQKCDAFWIGLEAHIWILIIIKVIMRIKFRTHF